MKKTVILSCMLALITTMGGSTSANDLYKYRLIRMDGKVFEINDKDYTEVYRKTVRDKEYWMAFKIVNKNKDTNIFKLQTNGDMEETGGDEGIPSFKIVRTFVNPNNPDEIITEMEKPIVRDLYGGAVKGVPWMYSIISGKTILGGKCGLAEPVNNAIGLQPTDFDTSLDLLRAGIISLGKRQSVTIEKDGISWWTNYTTQYRHSASKVEFSFLKNIMEKDGNWKIGKAKVLFQKDSDIHVWSIGRNKTNRDKSVNSIYLFYGQEYAQYFRLNKLDENIKPIRNESGFHTADGKTDMFGLGISKTKKFANGWYGDVLCQYAIFDRNIYTVNDGVYGRQHASVQGQDIGLSLEMGRKIQVHPNWSVQPEVQYTYHMYHQNAYKDSIERELGDKSIRDREIRAGVKVQYKWIYAKVNRYFRNSTGAKSHIDTEKEIGIERRINKDYTLRAFWSSYANIANRNRETGKIYKNSQNQFSLMLQKYF